MKPLGIAIGLHGNDPVMRVTQPTPAEDAIWEAVELAIENGMTPERFKREAAQAWEELLTKAGREAARELLAKR